MTGVQTCALPISYVGKTPIKFNLPEADAVERLVDLIKEHNKWVEPG